MQIASFASQAVVISSEHSNYTATAANQSKGPISQPLQILSRPSERAKGDKLKNIHENLLEKLCHPFTKTVEPKRPGEFFLLKKAKLQNLSKHWPYSICYARTTGYIGHENETNFYLQMSINAIPISTSYTHVCGNENSRRQW